MDDDRPILVLRIESEGTQAEALCEELTDRWGQAPAVWQPPTGGSVRLELYFDAMAEAALVEACLQAHPAVRGTEIRSTRPADWAASFRAQFRTFTVGRRLRVGPVWERDQAPADGRCGLWLDPGLSFGTGLHFTTRFCLEIIDQLWLQSPFSSFLDVGAGSGVLALAAARLGCPRVEAWERDVGVMACTQRNLELNDCADRVTLRAVDLREAPAGQRFEIVCANLIGGLIRQCADRLQQATERRLVLSGLREEETEEVAAAFVARGMKETHRSGDGEWSGLVMDGGG